MLSFLSSVVAAPLPLFSSEPSSETTDNGRRYLLIGQGDVVVGKFALDDNNNTEKLLVDALPGGLSVIGMLCPKSCDNSSLIQGRGDKFKVVTSEEATAADIATFETVSEKFVVLRLTCPKLVVSKDSTACNVPDTFMFSDSFGVGSASNSLESNNQPLSSAPPVVSVKPLFSTLNDSCFGVKDSAKVTLSLNLVCYMLRDPNATVGIAASLIHSTLKAKVTQGLHLLEQLSKELGSTAQLNAFTISSFPMGGVCVTACYPRSERALNTKLCTEFRQHVQSGFSHSHGPLMHPLYTPELTWGAAPQHGRKRAFAPLRNIHKTAVDTSSSNTHGTLYFVRGDYDYYHYRQGGLDDSGWGCAYRSMQTLCSWLHCNGYTQKPVPRHREIQEMLVEMDDKPLSFVGSDGWIGAVEISLCLQQMYGVQSRILSAQSGSDVAGLARDIADHFEENGSPIMVGGGVLAYTIIGLDWNKETGNVMFLILDPHYTGPDNPQNIKAGGWCAWKKPSLFKKEYFYNLCMPIKPSVI